MEFREKPMQNLIRIKEDVYKRQAQENFSGIAVIKAFVKELKELIAFRKLNKDNEEDVYKRQDLYNALRFAAGKDTAGSRRRRDDRSMVRGTEVFCGEASSLSLIHI